MRNRYIVRPCDNCGSIEGLKRDRTWDVIDRATDSCVQQCTTRHEARDAAKAWNTPIMEAK